MAKKYKIEHNNTDVRKLFTLAENGMIDKRTVLKIFDNDEDGYIVFNSKRIYERFIDLQYSVSALYCST